MYDAICAHKRQENFERYAGMKGQKPSAGGEAREGRRRRVSGEIRRSYSTSLNRTFCIIFATAHVRKFHRNGKSARITTTWCNTRAAASLFESVLIKSF